MFSRAFPFLFFGFILTAFSGVALFFVMLELTVLGGPIAAFNNGQPWHVRVFLYIVFGLAGTYMWNTGYAVNEQVAQK